MSSVDFLKGFIIVAIVGCHLMISSTGDAEAREMPFILQVLYLGLMAFFIISGYFYRPGKGFKYNMKKRTNQLVRALLICAVALPCIMFVWLSIVGQVPDLYDLWYGFIKALSLEDVFEPITVTTYYATCSASVGYYYLWTMVWGFVIFYALADYVMDDIKKCLITIAALLVVNILVTEYCRVLLPFQMQMGPIAALFMFLGAFMAKFKVIDRIEAFEWKDWKFWMLIIGSLVVGLGLCFFFHPGTEFDWLIFGDHGSLSVITYFFEAGAMFIVYIFLSKIVSMVPGISKIFTIAGQHTLGTLLLHGFVATMFIAPFFTITHTSWFPTEMTSTERFIVYVATIITCIVICRYGPKVVSMIREKVKKPSAE